MKEIVIKQLTKKTSESFHLNLRDLKLETGKIYGLVGPNGAGKTTVMKCLCGLLKTEGGVIEIDGRPIAAMAPELLSEVGTNFLNSDSLSGFSLEAIYNDHVFYYRIKDGLSIEELLEKVGLSVNKELPFNKLSLGMKQRFLLGLATLHNPSIVLLDEPFNGLDPDGVDLFIENITKMSRDKVIIVSSHVLRDMETFLDAVIFIENGHVREAKAMIEIREEYNEGLKDYYDEQKGSR